MKRFMLIAIMCLLISPLLLDVVNSSAENNVNKLISVEEAFDFSLKAENEADKVKEYLESTGYDYDLSKAVPLYGEKDNHIISFYRENHEFKTNIKKELTSWSFLRFKNNEVCQIGGIHKKDGKWIDGGSTGSEHSGNLCRDCQWESDMMDFHDVELNKQKLLSAGFKQVYSVYPMRLQACNLHLIYIETQDGEYAIPYNCERIKLESGKIYPFSEIISAYEKNFNFEEQERIYLENYVDDGIRRVGGDLEIKPKTDYKTWIIVGLSILFVVCSIVTGYKIIKANRKIKS